MRQGDGWPQRNGISESPATRPNNAQGDQLDGQVRQAQAARASGKPDPQGALQQSDSLAAQRKLEEAQYALLELQQDFPIPLNSIRSAAIDQKMKIARLV